MSDDFFGDTGWDGSMDDFEEEVAAAAPSTEALAAEETNTAVAEAPEETPEAVADEQPEERERDEQGRFLPKKIEVDDPAVIAYLDKYQGDPVKALKAATEAQAFASRQGNEVGELRRQLDEIQSRLNQPAPAAPQQITEEMIDRDPARATQLAYEQGNQAALAYAYEAWKDEDPASAAVWVATQQNQLALAERDRKIAELEARFAPVAQQQEDAAYHQELRTLGADAIAQIQAGAANLDQNVAGTLLHLLEAGTPDQKIGALKALRELTQGRTPVSATPDEVRNLAREAALAADEAIAEAAVVSATATRSEPAGKTLADAIGDEWDAIERPLTDGWNIG